MSRSRKRAPVTTNCAVNHSHQAEAKRMYRRRWRRSVKQTIKTLWSGTRRHLLPSRANKYNTWMLPGDGKHWQQDPPEGWDRK